MPVSAAGARLASKPFDSSRFWATWSSLRSKLKEVWVAGWSARFFSAPWRSAGLPAGGWAEAKTRVAERSAGRSNLGRRVVIYLASWLLDTEVGAELCLRERK